MLSKISQNIIEFYNVLIQRFISLDSFGVLSALIGLYAL